MAEIQLPYYNFNGEGDLFPPNTSRSWITTRSGDEVLDLTDRKDFDGLYPDILEVLQMEMNFTKKVYLRR